MYHATEDLCLTQDRRRAVPITDPEAFSLLVPEGSALSDAEATLYGLATVLLESKPATAPRRKRRPE